MNLINKIKIILFLITAVKINAMNSYEEVISKIFEYRAILAAKSNRWLSPCKCDSEKNPMHQGCYISDDNALDCSGLSYFMCTGKNGSIDKIYQKHDGSEANINIMDGISTTQSPNHHKNYTIYALLQLNLIGDGFSFIHFFTYLNNGRYISKTGVCGKVRIFNSFYEMVRTDGFIHGLPSNPSAKSNDKFANNPNQAYMADRIACGYDDITFTTEEFERFKNNLDEKQKKFFLSKISD